ncbi:hypothetical protein [Bacillus cereus]|uniref:hypothetical protein n=1 Tax=Bacillus cereus TaxID=1396 RepID=UPI000B4B832D|nr:hypothetical protein [Bacillus cereus]
MNKERKIYTMPELYVEKIQMFLSDLNLETNYSLDVERIYNFYELDRKYDSSILEERKLLLTHFTKEVGGFHFKDSTLMNIFNRIPVEYTNIASEIIKIVSIKYDTYTSFTYEISHLDNYYPPNMLILMYKSCTEIIRFIVPDWEIREPFIEEDRLAEEISLGLIKSVAREIEKSDITNKLLNEFPELLEEAYDRWDD